MKNVIKKIKNIEKYYLYMFLVSLFLVFPLISHNYYIGHDTQYHIANIDILANMFSEFKFSKIINVSAHNFGYGSGIFYPKLAHNVTAIIFLITRCFKIGVYSSVKLVHFINIFLSAIFMYKLILKIFKDKKTSFIASVIYITMPYFLYDIYFRDAYAESFVFIFMPIILLGIYDLLEGNIKRFYIEFIIGYIGMVNSHLVMSVFFTISLIIVMLVNYKRVFTKKNIICLFKASILILIFILPFLIPMIEHKITGLYAVFGKDLLGKSIESVNSKRLPIFRFFTFKQFNFHISSVVIILSILGIILLQNKKEDRKIKWFIYGIVISTLICFFITTNKFDWKYVPELLRSIQFPWRMLSITSFGMAILAGTGFYYLNKNEFVFYGIIVFCLLSSAYFINDVNFEPSKNYLYDYSEMSMGWSKEYLPTRIVTSKEKYAYYDKRDDKIKSSNKHVKIKVIENDTPYLKFKVSNLNSNDNTTIELPRIYYLGYEVTLKDNDNKKYKLNYKINENGFIKLNLDKNGIVYVKYIGTLGYRISIVINLITVIILVLYYRKIKVKRK